jgi:hypothetical protein
MDLMGPMPTSYTGGFRYVLTVTEDYSKLSQVSLLKTKDAAHTILNAIARLENMYGAQRKQCVLHRASGVYGYALDMRYRSAASRGSRRPRTLSVQRGCYELAAGIRACAC